MDIDSTLALTCECGFEARGDELDEVVAAAWAHARREHGIELPFELLANLVTDERERAHTSLARPSR